MTFNDLRHEGRMLGFAEDFIRRFRISLETSKLDLNNCKFLKEVIQHNVITYRFEYCTKDIGSYIRFYLNDLDSIEYWFACNKIHHEGFMGLYVSAGDSKKESGQCNLDTLESVWKKFETKILELEVQP